MLLFPVVCPQITNHLINVTHLYQRWERLKVPPFPLHRYDVVSLVRVVFEALDPGISRTTSGTCDVLYVSVISEWQVSFIISLIIQNKFIPINRFNSGSKPDRCTSQSSSVHCIQIHLHAALPFHSVVTNNGHLHGLKGQLVVLEMLDVLHDFNFHLQPKERKKGKCFHTERLSVYLFYYLHRWIYPLLMC